MPDTTGPLVEAFEIANRSKVLRRVAGVINIIVFDKTETPPPPSFPKTCPKVISTLSDLDPRGLTFWWRSGALLMTVLAKADAAVEADSWTSALEGIRETVRKRSPASGRPVKIGSLQFWGHGSDGTMYMGGDPLNARSFQPGSSHHDLLCEVRDVMHPREGSVWFRGCQTFRSARGKEFAKTAANFFRVPVVGHTFIIWAIQSGTRMLAPGSNPGWSADEGHGRRNDDLWSDPFRKKSVSMLKFYPPSAPADLVSALKLLSLTKVIPGI